jgi:hypothetical protein
MKIDNAKLVSALGGLLKKFDAPVTIIKDGDGISIFSTYSDNDGKDFVGSCREEYTLGEAVDTLETVIKELENKRYNLIIEVERLEKMRSRIQQQLEVSMKGLD